MRNRPDRIQAMSRCRSISGMRDSSDARSGERDTGRLMTAIEAHQSSRMEEAEKGYLQCLAHDPSDPDALHYLGMLRFQQGRRDDSERLIRASLEIRPDNPHAWNNLGNVLFAQEQLDDAVDAYLHAIDANIELGAAWQNLGRCLERSASPEQAIALFKRVIETLPGFVPAYEALGRVLRVFGRHEGAIETYRRWVELEPDRPTARHMLAAVTNEEVPDKADAAYVRETFDAFADVFDEKLERLAYRAPQLLIERVESLVGSPSASLHILDAGCGTGLCGPLLRPFASRLVGVDLSRGMLERARERGCYDALRQEDLVTYMGFSASQFDGVLSADTLCYFGSLDEALLAARTALRAAGWLAFTVERWSSETPRDSFRIEPHGRYAHTATYVDATLRKSGFAVQRMDEVVLRKEIFQDVSGLAVVARAR